MNFATASDRMRLVARRPNAGKFQGTKQSVSLRADQPSASGDFNR
jgi:hypothetical protein